MLRAKLRICIVVSVLTLIAIGIVSAFSLASVALVSATQIFSGDRPFAVERSQELNERVDRPEVDGTRAGCVADFADRVPVMEANRPVDVSLLALVRPAALFTSLNRRSRDS